MVVRGRGPLLVGLGLLAAGALLLTLASRTGERVPTNGERIYFTGRNQDGERISYRGGATSGMTMAGGLACVSCHGVGARGGRHRMHMVLMDAPDIRWSALAGADEEHGDADGGYDLAMFRRAVVDGRHPDGEPLGDLMPRWRLSDRDLADLAAYLRSLD